MRPKARILRIASFEIHKFKLLLSVVHVLGDRVTQSAPKLPRYNLMRSRGLTPSQVTYGILLDGFINDNEAEPGLGS